MAASVDAAIALAPEHLSLYMLEVYPNAPLKDDMARARWSQAPDDDAAVMYVEAMERLEAAGLEQYEISNVARAGPPLAPQPEILDRWGMARLRLRRPLDPRRRPVEELSSTEEYVDQVGRGASIAVDVRRLSPDQRLGDALVHCAAPG